jgi:hypothetical protein
MLPIMAGSPIGIEAVGGPQAPSSAGEAEAQPDEASLCVQALVMSRSSHHPAPCFLSPRGGVVARGGV